MRFLLYFPLPLLLILYSLVASSHADYTYAKRSESDRIRRTNDDIKPMPLAGEDINSLSFDELEKKYKEAEEKRNKLNATLNAAKTAWEQKLLEANNTQKEYETKKAEWEIMDAAAFKEENDAEKARQEYTNAEEEEARLNGLLSTATENVEKWETNIDDARNAKEKVEKEPTRFDEAKRELKVMTDDRTCEKLAIETPKLKTEFDTAKSNARRSQNDVTRQQGRVKSCTPDCAQAQKTLAKYEEARDKAVNALNTANETYTKTAAESKACPGKQAALVKEVAELTEYVPKNAERLVEATNAVTALEGEESALKQAAEKARTDHDAAVGIVEEKNTAKLAAEALDEQNPKNDEKLAASDAAQNLQSLLEKIRNLDDEVGELKKNYDDSNKVYQEYENDSSVAELKQVYEKRVQEKREEPGTGSLPIIAAVVVGILLLIGIAFLVFMIVTNKRNGRKPLALVLPFGKAGKRAGKGPQNPSTKQPSDPSVAPQQVSDNKSNQAVPAASNNEIPAVKSNDAPTDGQNTKRDDDNDEWTPTSQFTFTSLKELESKKELKSHELEYLKDNMKDAEYQIQLYKKNEVIVFSSKTGLRGRLYMGREEGVVTVSSFQSVKKAKFYTAVEDMTRDLNGWLHTLKSNTYDKLTPCPLSTRILVHDIDTKYRLTKTQVDVQDAFMKDITFIRNYAIWRGNEINKEDKERSGAGSDNIVDKDERTGAGRTDDEEEDDDRKQTTVTVAKKRDSNRKPHGSVKKKKQPGSTRASLDSGSGRITEETKVKKLRIPKNVVPENEQKFEDLKKKYGLSELNYGPHMSEYDQVKQERLDAFMNENGFDKLNDSGIDSYLEHLNKCIKTGEKSDPNILTPKIVHAILYKVTTENFENEERVIRNLCRDTYHIVADLHGNADDLKTIFESFGGIDSKEFKEQKFIFIGDYVDRGKFSLEVITLLFCLKMKYPGNFTMLRGNHESYDVNVSYGFYQELRQHFGIEEGTRLLGHFGCCFQTIPVAAVANNVLFVHGGISDKLHSLAQIADIDKRIFDPRKTAMVDDLLWSDAKLNLMEKGKCTRGVSQPFGRVVIRNAIIQLEIAMIVRGHQKAPNGNEFFFPDIGLITLFSASGYEGHRNFGAFLTITSSNAFATTIYGARQEGDDEIAVKTRIHDNYALQTNYVNALPNVGNKGKSKEDASITVDHREEEMKKMGKK